MVCILTGVVPCGLWLGGYPPDTLLYWSWSAVELPTGTGGSALALIGVCDGTVSARN